MLNIERDSHSYFKKTLANLKRKQKPNLLYGAGEVAERVANILSGNGVQIDAICSDEPVEDQVFLDKPVQNIQTIQAIDNYSVIIGFGDYKRAAEQLDHRFGIKEPFFVDNIYALPHISPEFCSENSNELNDFYSMLGDKKSKETLNAFINARLTGDPRNLFSHYDKDQYFPRDVEGYLPFSDCINFVDCGAYTGDTLSDFVKVTRNSYEKAYCFEPDPNNFVFLKSHISEAEIKRTVAYNSGVGSVASIVKFHPENIASRVVENGPLEIDIKTIDGTVQAEGQILIKMDVEGYEMDALLGARDTIVQSKPKLAISIYHKPSDLLDIPRFIKSCCPDYKLFLRAHKSLSIDVILYAIPT